MNNNRALYLFLGIALAGISFGVGFATAQSEKEAVVTFPQKLYHR